MVHLTDIIKEDDILLEVLTNKQIKNLEKTRII